MNIPASLSILGATPATLKAWLDGQPEHVLLQKEHPEAWNTIDIIKHLIFGEQTDWIPRLTLMIEAEQGKMPVLKSFDREGHQQNTEQDISKVLQHFSELRRDNLDTLKQFLKNYDFANLKAIHPDLGPVNGNQLLATWTVHDQTHIYQIARNLTSLFADDVGPWAAYLRIVSS
ncbi:MAG: DinB family protein [Balneolaceae bacterium]